MGHPVTKEKNSPLLVSKQVSEKQRPAQNVFFQPDIQPWSGYCPSCTHLDQKICNALPCQTYNLKACNTYAGIEKHSPCPDFLTLACQEALISAKDLQGGPFGAVLVQLEEKNNGSKVKRYWVGHNQVTNLNDPTAHAEIQVIRKACQDLGKIDLSDCVLFSSCETCPLCTGAIYWAHIPRVCFASTRYDAGAQGVNFADDQIFFEMSLPYSQRKLVRFEQYSCEESLDAFNYWKRDSASIPY